MSNGRELSGAPERAEKAAGFGKRARGARAASSVPLQRRLTESELRNCPPLPERSVRELNACYTEDVLAYRASRLAVALPVRESAVGYDLSRFTRFQCKVICSLRGFHVLLVV